MAQLLVQRYDAMPLPMRHTLAVAACIGQTFSSELLADAEGLCQVMLVLVRLYACAFDVQEGAHEAHNEQEERAFQ